MHKPGYDPELYALVHRGNPGDAEFYARVCRDARVLELGSGYGRLLQPLASVARAYCGLELDPGQLALARRRVTQLPQAQRARVELVAGDMTSFEFGRCFDRILIPYSGLYCLQDERAVRACFGHVRRHLAPGGQLWIDAYHADPFHEESSPADLSDQHLEHIADVEHRGVHYRVDERSHWDRDIQQLTVSYRYDCGGDRTPYEATIVHRYLLCDQLATSLYAEGFRTMRFFGDFDGAPLTDEDETMIVMATLG